MNKHEGCLSPAYSPSFLFYTVDKFALIIPLEPVGGLVVHTTELLQGRFHQKVASTNKHCF